MKYKYLVLALVPFFAIFLTACSLSDLPVIGGFFGPKVDNTPVTLNFWGLWEQSSVYEPALASYNSKKPNVTVNYENRALGGDLFDYKNRVFQGSTVAGSVPDVYMVHNGWVPRFSTINLFTPAPKSVVDALKINENFYKVAVDSGFVNGNLYAVPAYYDGLVLVYNKTHFAGIEQTNPPTTWEEFRILATKLTVRSEDNTLVRAGAAMGTADNIDHFSDILGLLWAQQGLNIPDNLDTEAAADALSFYTTFSLEDEVWNNDMPESVTAFIRGQASMIFVPSWQVLTILDNVNDASIVGVAPVPQVPNVAQQANWGTFWMYAVPANSPNPELAWDFIMHLASVEQAKTIFSNQSNIRKFGAPYANSTLASDLSTNPYLAPVLAGAPTARSFEIAGRSGNRSQVGALQIAVNNLLLENANEYTPETVLQTAKKTITGN